MAGHQAYILLFYTPIIFVIYWLEMMGYKVVLKSGGNKPVLMIKRSSLEGNFDLIGL